MYLRRIYDLREDRDYTQKKVAEYLGLDKKQMCFDGDTSRHYHLVCRSCGAVEDILPGDMGNVEKELESKLTGRIQSVSVNFSGYCEKCASRAKREALLS